VFSAAVEAEAELLFVVMTEGTEAVDCLEFCLTSLFKFSSIFFGSSIEGWFKFEKRQKRNFQNQKEANF